MAYDEELADRVRECMQDVADVTEKRMFGGLAFMVSGNMAVAASGQGGLMLRCDPAGTESLVATDGVDRMVMRGRAMDGWLRVDPSVVAEDQELSHWVRLGVSYAKSLPAK
jgi:TfoX/Sxy family transcriptional regulator of competence genes